MIPTAYAATAREEAFKLVGLINDAILFPLIALLMAVAFLVFLWGAFEYVKNSDNDTGREKGRNHLLYGTIGMLVMLSAYAILSIAASTFGLQEDLDKSTDSAFSGSGATTGTGSGGGAGTGVGSGGGAPTGAGSGGGTVSGTGGGGSVAPMANSLKNRIESEIDDAVGSSVDAANDWKRNLTKSDVSLDTVDRAEELGFIRRITANELRDYINRR